MGRRNRTFIPKLFIKRPFDFVVALIGLVILSPAMLLISCASLFLMPGGSIFYRQKRVGRDGKTFVLIKFRTMYVDLKESTVTVKGDKNITKFGAFLRKTKLDELPELWNVLTGEMSLVGPRPDVAEYMNRLVGSDRKILTIRPGITGPATLKYAKEEDLLANQLDPITFNDEVIFPDKVRMNLDYIENWSFGLDLKILFQTIFARNTNEWQKN